MLRSAPFPIGLGVLLWLASSAESAGPPPIKPEALKGVGASGNCIACIRDPGGMIRLDVWIQPLRGGNSVRVLGVAAAAYLPVRWHVCGNSLFVADALDKGIPGPYLVGEGCQRYELPDLFKGFRVVAPGEKPQRARQAVGGGLDATPVYDARMLCDRERYDLEVYYDYLPTGRTSAKLFVLTNVEGKSNPAPVGSGEPPSFPARKRKPKWSFTTHTSGSSYWDSEEERWVTEEWKDEGSLDLSFREAFQALLRGQDYYFLTASGKLFRAPPPAKGKHRKVEKVWDDPRSRIVAQIQDANRGRTFLFCARGPKGKGGPFLFELGSGVRPRFYDPRTFKPGEQGPDTLRTVVGYARVLEALGYLKVPQKPATTKGRPR